MYLDYRKIADELEATKKQLKELNAKYGNELQFYKQSFAEEVESLQSISSNLMSEICQLRDDKANLLFECENLGREMKKAEYQNDLYRQTQEVKISLLREALTKKNLEMAKLGERNDQMKSLIDTFQKNHSDLDEEFGKRDDRIEFLENEIADLMADDLPRRYIDVKNAFIICESKLKQYEEKIRLEQFLNNSY